LLLACKACHVQFFSDVKPGDDSFYESLAKRKDYYSHHKPEFEFVQQQIARLRPQSFLDFGSGSGDFLITLHTVPKKRAFEFNRVAREALMKRGLSLHQEDDKYDFISFFQVLEHLANYQEFRRCIQESLNPGGHVFISTPNPESPEFSEMFQILDHPPHHLTRWSRDAFRALAHSLELKELSYFQEPYSRAHFFELLKARRRQLTGEGIRGRALFWMGQIFDRIYAPYYDLTRYAGPTHGVLLRKGGKA
jgi:SAM-dependent methyltransferase